MKKFGLMAILFGSLALAWCNCKCDVAVEEPVVDEDAALNAAIDYCIENGWTHSLIHSQTAAYGECSFPSWVICEDTILGTDECNFEPNLESIDTEQKRLSGCVESVHEWVEEMEKWEVIDATWDHEEEAWASFVRNGVVRYSKDWTNRKLPFECVADFVDWSLSVSYEDAVAEDNTEETSEDESTEESELEE